MELTHSVSAPNDVLLARGPQIVAATLGGPLRAAKPFTPEVRANIDYELVDKSIDFMRRQKAAGKPFFLYLPFSMGHAPNLPAKEFAGKSRIGNYGDKLMEGDYHVGQILDTLKELGVDNDTIVVFASDNGPYGEAAREFGNHGTPDMGSSGPFRGELGELTEGAIRTAALIRWPGQIKPNTTSYAMFSIMDFLPTFAHIVGGKMPTDRPIDGVDQTDVLLGNSAMGHRENLLSFIGGDWSPPDGSSGGSTSPTFIPLASGRSGNRAFSRPVLRWLATRRSTISRWTRTRTSSSEDCLAGCRTPRSKRSKSTWRRSRNIPILRRPTLPNSGGVVVSFTFETESRGRANMRWTERWRAQISKRTMENGDA
jgi:hypothetical protein